MHNTASDGPSTRLSELLARTALGDRASFTALYRATSATLFGSIVRIVREPALAEEVLQEVYVTIWHSAQGFEARQGLAMTWLTSIARNRAIDALRRRAARPNTVSRFGPLDGGSDDEGVDALEHLPSDAPGPLQLLEDASRAHALEQCMDALNGSQRSCLALAYYRGLSHSEVAEHLHQPLGTVKTWLRRALQSLRGCLDRATGSTASAEGAA